jgi:hypothetical protein
VEEIYVTSPERSCLLTEFFWKSNLISMPFEKTAFKKSTTTSALNIMHPHGIPKSLVMIRYTVVGCSVLLVRSVVMNDPLDNHWVGVIPLRSL